MNYFKHFKLNITVAFRGFVLCLFHLVHAIIPIKYTSHEYWNIYFSKEIKCSDCREEATLYRNFAGKPCSKLFNVRELER